MCDSNQSRFWFSIESTPILFDLIPIPSLKILAWFNSDSHYTLKNISTIEIQFRCRYLFHLAILAFDSTSSENDWNWNSLLPPVSAVEVIESEPCVCLSVCLWALSRPNRLTYDLGRTRKCPTREVRERSGVFITAWYRPTGCWCFTLDLLVADLWTPLIIIHYFPK